LAAFLNRHFPPAARFALGVIWRETLLAGFYFAALAWLQMGRAFTWPLAVLLGAGMLAVEGVLRLLERTPWRPETGITDV
jgi:hypothetical protein